MSSKSKLESNDQMTYWMQKKKREKKKQWKFNLQSFVFYFFSYFLFPSSRHQN